MLLCTPPAPAGIIFPVKGLLPIPIEPMTGPLNDGPLIAVDNREPDTRQFAPGRETNG